jgi:hypothetical protein
LDIGIGTDPIADVDRLDGHENPHLGSDNGGFQSLAAPLHGECKRVLSKSDGTAITPREAHHDF